MVWIYTQCPCVPAPICPGPGGGNPVDPILPSVCGELVSSHRTPPGPPPPPPPPPGGIPTPPDSRHHQPPPPPPPPPKIPPDVGPPPPPHPPQPGPKPDSKWKCVETFTTIVAAPPPGMEWVDPHNYKVCVPCDGKANQLMLGGFNPQATDPACIYKSKIACEVFCINHTRPIFNIAVAGDPPAVSPPDASPIGDPIGTTSIISAMYGEIPIQPPKNTGIKYGWYGEMHNPSPASSKSAAQTSRYGGPFFFGGTGGEEDASLAERMPKVDKGLELYNPEHTMLVQQEEDILVLANAKVPSSKFTDPNAVFNSQSIPKTVSDLLGSTGVAASSTSYNGTTLGALLYSDIIKKSLSPATEKQLQRLSIVNSSHMGLASQLVQAIKKAAINESIEDYSPDLFKQMANTQATNSFPANFSTLNTTTTAEKTSVAFSLLKNQGVSLNTAAFPNGTDARICQKTRLLPEDIQLNMKVMTYGGKETSVFFKNDDGLRVTKQDGTVEHPKQVNEFMFIVKQDGSKESLTLGSNRDISYTYYPTARSVITGLLGDGAFVGTKMEVSATGSVETTSTGSTLAEYYLFSSIRESITEVPSSKSYIKTTEVTYELAVAPGIVGDNTKFNEVVNLYSGPRQSFSISNKDPIWNMIEQVDEVEGDKRFVTLTFSTPNANFTNRNVPQWVFTDIMLIPTDVTNFNLLQGGSILINETTSEPTKRVTNFVDSPIPSPEAQYAISERSTTNPEGEQDLWGMSFTKSFADGQKRKAYSKADKVLSSTQSLLKEMIALTTQIDTNYDLYDGRTGTKTLFSGDLYSFLTLNKSIRFMTELPGAVVDKFNTGGYNGVSIIPCPVNEIETTKISTARLKSTGTSMTSQQLTTKIPLSLGYYSSIFKDKIWGA